MRKLESALPRTLSDLTPERYQEFLADMEREYFNSALESTDGNAAEVANRIGLGRSTIFKKLKVLNCNEKPQARAPGLTVLVSPLQNKLYQA